MRLDLTKFRGKLPYAREAYGIYQPLIGWKSRLIQNRLQLDRVPLPGASWLDPAGDFDINADFVVSTDEEVDLFAKAANPAFVVPSYLDGLLVRFLQVELRELLTDHPEDDTDFWRAYWTEVLAPEALNARFVDAVRSVSGTSLTRPDDFDAEVLPLVDYLNRALIMFATPDEAERYVYTREAYVARFLHGLLPGPGDDPAGFPGNVNALLLHLVPTPGIADLLKAADPFELAVAGQREAVLSPVGIVHLFQQYFFEFDTFLGPPVEHIWLSPGTTTELIEVSTRRVLEEQTFERFSESIARSETSTTHQDELSRAIRDENQKNTKLGSSLSGGVNFLVAHVEASGSVSLEETQKEAREETHRTVRQQSAKLSSEIRSNYKSTFRTVTEVTDTRSKRYVIENPTGKLLNYELRRKMRQVGVQLQDIGTALCWQVYVDDAGAELGVSQLVHLASQADLSKYAHQPLKPAPDPLTDVVTVLLPIPKPGQRSEVGPIVAAGFVGAMALGAAATGAAVGVAVYEVLDSLFGDDEEEHDWYTIGPTTTVHQGYKVPLPDGYRIAATQEEDEVFLKGIGQIPLRWLGKNGMHLQFHANVLNPSEGLLDLVVNAGDVTPGELIEFQLKITIDATQQKKDAITAENTAIATENANKDVERERRIREEFVASVKDRVKLAAGVKARPDHDLREEERTVIYRHLIRRLMREAWSLSTDRKVAHLRSELIKSIFDVDRLLYFVAPEWWQPRLHRSSQVLGADRPDYSATLNAASIAALTTSEAIGSLTDARTKRTSLGTLGTEDLVGWGGEGRSDNYLITEDSAPARLGASLGWLLQLDGDNLRNAFLNAPWVKAVIPVRPGREREALEWLEQSKVEGSEGLGEIYAGADAPLFKAKYTAKHGTVKDPTVEEVLDLLADDLVAKHEASLVVRSEEIEVGPDQTQTVYYLPPDEVFEKGFDPLQGGFDATLDADADDKHFRRFDQWIEVLPTDQIVAVQVQYDPVTGLQVPVEE